MQKYMPFFSLEAWYCLHVFSVVKMSKLYMCGCYAVESNRFALLPHRFGMGRVISECLDYIASGVCLHKWMNISCTFYARVILLMISYTICMYIYIYRIIPYYYPGCSKNCSLHRNKNLSNFCCNAFRVFCHHC